MTDSEVVELRLCMTDSEVVELRLCMIMGTLLMYRIFLNGKITRRTVEYSLG